MRSARDFVCVSLVCFAVLWAGGCQTPYGKVKDPLESGNLAGMKAVLASEPDLVHARTGGGYTPLHAAVQIGSVEAVDVMLANGAEIDAVTNEKTIPQYGDWGFTPLYFAARYGHKDVAAVLIARGARVDAATRIKGWTPLHAAASMDASSMSNFLFSNGWGNEAWKVGREHKDVAELLIAGGANVNARISDGSTVLILAALYYNKFVAEALIAKGAAVNVQNSLGSAPLHIAAKNGQTDLAAILIAGGADVNLKTNAGTTPLHLAAGNGHVEMAELLIAKGADVNVSSNNDGSPLHWLCKEGKTYTQVMSYPDKGAHIRMVSQRDKVAELLVAKGADVNARNPRGFTPVQLATATGQVDVVRLLRKHGGLDN